MKSTGVQIVTGGVSHENTILSFGDIARTQPLRPSHRFATGAEDRFRGAGDYGDPCAIQRGVDKR